MVYHFFTFCWPCIAIYLCNKNQIDALLILSLFRQSTSKCFGHIYSPLSGCILYVYNSCYVLCFLVDCLLVWLGWNQADRQSTEKHSTYQMLYIYFHPNQANRQSTKKWNTYQLLYTYSIPPDDGLQICPKHVEVDWRNKLRINSASSWFFFFTQMVCHVEGKAQGYSITKCWERYLGQRGTT